MKKLRTLGLTAAAVLALAAGPAEARDQIRIVGSSTVFPFASYVVEEFGATTQHPTPVIESTGSGGGFKLFCAGVGMETPDITNASRRIKPSELERCRENGVEAVTEVEIGADGIVVANRTDAPRLELSREQLTRAVAAEVPKDGELVDNPYKRWDDIDPELPDAEILVYGPPSTSGTRDAFEELVMEAASEEMEGYGGGYTKIRQDGAYVPAGENDNLIVQKLNQNPDAVGIFGYSFLEENSDRVQASRIDGVAPEAEAIASGEYPVSRSLFFYVKNAHEGKVPGLAEYVELFLAEKMIGELGYLKRLGLIPLPRERREEMRQRFADREPVEVGDLE
ncbi:phosphate-binding protein [Thiohalorhabdus denitrificans]|uniref:Phosphate ABC transporter substrate-binding protein, PhoT family n=1 Tax=Thiohalorhabdus denitrificans TaxID=381306 RepID=A0A0P9GHA6_9GAMM|nr:PstS family phosphate ABC transporter substrate-binding protein [Thiohalorhabdus denitrificans]KPV39391.1 phosphate-binding protein [Thiohalorhabdus denitrificans]SCY67318.1 phosphate ABC transporter substrate-binding protein, PhoT family [Thiohalorhabdus denitrificans]